MISTGLSLTRSAFGGSVYPKNGRVLDLAAFNYTYSEVRDKSPEDNETVLYSGRAVHTDGVADYIKIPLPSIPYSFNDVLTVTGTVRDSGAAETIQIGTTGFSYTVGVYPETSGSGLWETFEWSYAASFSGNLTEIRLGERSGQLSELEWADVTVTLAGVVIWSGYLNEHTDPTVDGLDGLPCLDSSGNGYHGTYTGCTAVTQIGFDSALAGLGAYGDKPYFGTASKSPLNGLSTADLTSSGSFWMAWKGMVTFASSTDQVVFGAVRGIQGFHTGGVGFQFSSDKFRIANENSGSTRLTLGSSVNAGLGQVVTLLGVFDATTNMVYLYQDGVEVGSSDWTGAVFTSTNDFQLMASTDVNGNLYTPKTPQGIIYDCAVGQGTLDATQAQEIYQQGLGPWFEDNPTEFANCLSYLPVDETTGPTLFDKTSNGYDCTLGSGAGWIAELRTTPPQVLGMDFNQYRWFNGVDTSLDYGSPLFPATADFDETFHLFIGLDSPPASFTYAVQQPQNTSTGNFGLALSSSTGQLALVLGSNTIQDTGGPYFREMVKVRITRTSGTFEFFVNDVSVGVNSDAFSIPQSGNTTFGDAPPLSGNRHWTGLIYGDKVTGTESGTFENVLVPESLTKGTDALGNAIESPRSNKTFNADGSGYGLTPASPSLILTTELSGGIKGNFYGPKPSVNKYIYGQYDATSTARSWAFAKASSASASDNHIQLILGDLNGAFNVGVEVPVPDAEVVIYFTYDNGALNVYVDGGLTPYVEYSGILTGTSLTSKSIPLTYNGRDYDGSSVLDISDIPFEALPIYNRALTAEEVAKFK